MAEADNAVGTCLQYASRNFQHRVSLYSPYEGLCSSAGDVRAEAQATGGSDRTTTRPVSSYWNAHAILRRILTNMRNSHPHQLVPPAAKHTQEPALQQVILTILNPPKKIMVAAAACPAVLSQAS